MSEYVIVGDTAQYKGCLIYVCGTSYEHAHSTLNRMLNDPTEEDKKMKKYMMKKRKSCLIYHML